MNVLNDVKTTCRMLSISQTTLYEEIKGGRIVPVKIGTRTLFHRDEVQRYVASLGNAGKTTSLNLSMLT